MVCQTSGIGSCDEKGVTYLIMYGKRYRKSLLGESSRNSYSREEEHLDEFRRKTKDSVLLRHCTLDNDSEI